MVNLKRALTTATALWLALMLSAPTIATAQEAGQAAQPGATRGAPQVAQPESGVNWSGVGYGATAVVSNLVYVPAKIVYGVLGGIVGGFAWVLTAGNSEVSDTIWRSSLGGDYLVTPQMIAGEQPLHFNGPTKTEELGSAAPQPASSTPPSPSASAPGASPLTLDRGTGPVGGAGAPTSGGAAATAGSVPAAPGGATAPAEPGNPNIE